MSYTVTLGEIHELFIKALAVQKLFLMLHKEIGPTILWYEGNLSNNIQCII